MKRFTITDFDWKEFPMHPEKFDGYQLSLKCKVVFEEPIERKEECGYGDDKICFTLIALDDEGFAICKESGDRYKLENNEVSRII